MTSLSTRTSSVISDALANSDDWQSVIAHFDYHEGFSFGLLALANPGVLTYCRESLREHLRSLGKDLLDLSQSTPEGFVEVCLSLRNYRVDENVGAIWIAAVISEHDPSYSEWRSAFRTAFARLNSLRNVLQQELRTNLLFVCSPWVQIIIRNIAPDLWSVRSAVTDIRLQLPNLTERLQRRPRDIDRSERDAPDPLFALREADKLRGLARQELNLARLLYRAAKGFLDRGQLGEALQLFDESLKLRQKFGATDLEIADTEKMLAQALIMGGHFDEARILLYSALEKLEENEYQLRSSIYLQLGIIAAEMQQFGDARHWYFKTQALMDNHGDKRGSAAIYHQLGMLAAEEGDLEQAKEWTMRSLAIEEANRNERGAASSYHQLGLISAYKHDYEEARGWYLKSLAVEEKMHNLRGQAASLHQLGMLAAEQLDFITARNLYLRSAEIEEELGNGHGAAVSYGALGILAEMQGQNEDAGKWLVRTIGLLRGLSDPHRTEEAEQQFASLYQRSSKFEKERLVNAWNEAGLGPLPQMGTPSRPV